MLGDFGSCLKLNDQGKVSLTTLWINTYIEGEGEGEGERVRDRQRERQRERDRERDRESEGDRQRERDRERERERERERAYGDVLIVFFTQNSNLYYRSPAETHSN